MTPTTPPWPAMPFAVSDLDRADARRRDPEWLAARLVDERTRLLLLWRGRPLCDSSGALKLLSPGSRAELMASAGTPIFLGLRAADALFAHSLEIDTCPQETLGPGEFFSEARAAAASLSLADSSAFAQARSLFEWHRHHGFCSRCGAATTITLAGYKRRCPACSAEHFPRTDPVVIMMITRGDRCLLGRQQRFPPGLFTCLAGFIEPAETVEDAVRRESFEEAGISCGRVHYLGSQPWPFPSQLMIACEAEANDEQITIDGHELEEARWFGREELRSILAGAEVGPGPWIPPPIAVAHHLIQRWVARPKTAS